MSQLRRLPAVDLLLNTPQGRDLISAYGRPLTLNAIRSVLDQARDHFHRKKIIPDQAALLSRCASQLNEDVVRGQWSYQERNRVIIDTAHEDARKYGNEVQIWGEQEGGSAGKEGPCAQIGAGLSSLFADLLRFDDHDRKKLVISGISAGFAAVFGTPIAGSIFGVELLFVDAILYEVLLPSFIAGIMSYQVSSAMGIKYFHHSIDFVPVFNESFFIIVVFAGIFFGICSIVLIESLKVGEKLSHKVKLWAPLKGIIGGVVLIGLTLVFSNRYLGLGLDTIESCLRGEHAPWCAFLMKPVFTSITLSFGGSGGIVTPIFFVGAAAGAALATVLVEAGQNEPSPQRRRCVFSYVVIPFDS